MSGNSQTWKLPLVGKITQSVQVIGSWINPVHVSPGQGHFSKAERGQNDLHETVEFGPNKQPSDVVKQWVLHENSG